MHYDAITLPPHACQDAFVCAKSSNHGMVHFLEGGADSSSGGGAMDRGKGSEWAVASVAATFN